MRSDHGLRIHRKSIDVSNLDLLEEFLESAESALDSFRYFESRPLEVISNHIKTFIWLNNNNPIGYGHLDSEDGKVWLGICIIVKFQGIGLGKKMLQELIMHSKEEGLKEIFLSVDHKNNQAVFLYKQHGFVEVNILNDKSIYKLDLYEHNDIHSLSIQI